MKNRHAARLTTACTTLCLLAALAAWAPHARANVPARPAQGSTQTFNLADFGAVGDGVADDGPALQRALDAVMRAGGGTLNVPAGRYVIATPVHVIGPLTFDVPLTIRGVPSSTPIAPPTASGQELSQGLNLASEFYPRTGPAADAITLWNFSSLRVEDLAFVGSPDTDNDARNTVAIADAVEAVFRHCEFYGLATMAEGGSIIQAQRSHLSIEQTAFLGCTANSGVYAPVVENFDWKGINVEDSIFIDYGQRPELYAKTGLGAPLSWINVGNAARRTPDSPRREVTLRNVFLDEGGWQAVTVMPARFQDPVPLDLFYATNLYVNVSNFVTNGLYLTGTRRVLVEDSTFTYSRQSNSAVYILDAEDAVLDRVRTEANATRIIAESLTSRLTVIDSVYEDLASSAQQTVVLNPSAPDEDPVRYVRSRFETPPDSSTGRAGSSTAAPTPPALPRSARPLAPTSLLTRRPPSPSAARRPTRTGSRSRA